jgi:prolyl oligopeptidase PreP (S9A serine peptidase family)
MATRRRIVWSGTADGDDAAIVEMKQIWYASSDGTRVPMMVIQKKGTARDGQSSDAAVGVRRV